MKTGENSISFRKGSYIYQKGHYLIKSQTANLNTKKHEQLLCNYYVFKTPCGLVSLLKAVHSKQSNKMKAKQKKKTKKKSKKRRLFFFLLFLYDDVVFILKWYGPSLYEFLNSKSVCLFVAILTSGLSPQIKMHFFPTS